VRNKNKAQIPPPEYATVEMTNLWRCGIPRFQETLGKDDEFMVLAVWDVSSGRLGTLQMPLPDPSTRRKPARATQKLISK
jgi:hypothetical protein